MALFVVLFLSWLQCGLSGWESPLESAAKISPQEREQISKNAATASQRAYAPTKGMVAKLLAVEAHMEKECPKCDDKDYSDACPLGWKALPDGRCKAPASYTGMCGDTQTFMGSSVAQKMELETSCEICWPCTRGNDQAATCIRDWTSPCPQGFTPQEIVHNELQGASGANCVANIFYEGECEQQVVFNDVAAKHEFAERCQTSWPCQQMCQDNSCQDAEDMSGGGKGQQKSTSFLAARVLPVDAYKIRNSLFLSQLLRMPAAAAVNVVEHEDVPQMYEQAKYKAMQGQSARLDHILESKFRLLAQTL